MSLLCLASISAYPAGQSPSLCSLYIIIVTKRGICEKTMWIYAHKKSLTIPNSSYNLQSIFGFSHRNVGAIFTKTSREIKNRWMFSHRYNFLSHTWRPSAYQQQPLNHHSFCRVESFLKMFPFKSYTNRSHHH